MLASPARTAANQRNALKSTGPTSAMGKSVVANNALKHGLFSKNLILDDEDPAEYESLLDQLQAELSPQGVLEQALTERIAVSLWRQKRLVRAETASIGMDARPARIAVEVGQELGHKLSEQDLTDYDAGLCQWCEAVLNEHKAIDRDPIDLTQLKESSPLIYEEFLNSTGQSPNDFVIGLSRWCWHQIKLAQQRPLVVEVARMVKDKRAILNDNARLALANYQVMLDNELYKAIRALREAQEWRFKSLAVDGFVFRD